MSKVSKLNEVKDLKQRPLSLTQVKRMKSQTEIEKSQVGESLKNDQVTPLKASLTPDPSIISKSAVKSQGWTESFNSKETQICSISAKPTKIVRKDSRSLTAVASPVDTYGETIGDGGRRPIRRLTRTKTQLPNLIKLKNQGFCSISPNKTPPPFLDFPDTQMDQKNFLKSPKDQYLGKTTPRPSEKSFNSTLRNNHKFSINSYNSNTSLNFGEGQFDLLNELTKSVRELNQRLIRSEEITIERLKENLELKNKLKTLESKIDDQKMHKLENSEVKSGCSQKCRIM